ncbi:MAG: GNAT family N-acetyltransferase, partial [Anaerolineae bacterium]|nr:GNAT family N-acetyltransferase [Anaerolineae bacterium]
MTLTVRLADPALDYPGIAELLSQKSNEPITVAELRDEDIPRVAGKILKRWVAMDTENQLSGYGMVVKYPSEPADLFHLVNLVNPARCGQGIDSQLLAVLLNFIREHPAAGRVMTEIRADDKAALGFANKHGFTVDHHVFDSRLEVATFDEQRFTGVLERVQQTGIQFTTLAELGNTEAAQRQVYELNRMAVFDEPASTGTFLTYENWRRLILEADWYRPVSQFLALAGEKFVGLAGIYNDPGQTDMFAAFAGVEREYRGQGIAT